MKDPFTNSDGVKVGFTDAVWTLSESKNGVTIIITSKDLGRANRILKRRIAALGD